MKKTLFVLFCYWLVSGLYAQKSIPGYFHITDERIQTGQIALPARMLVQMKTLQDFEERTHGTPCDGPAKTVLSNGGQFRVSNFQVPQTESLVLKNDLLIWSEGDVTIDGNILGEMIQNSNRNGQSLSIGSSGTIFVRGVIALSDGGNGLDATAVPNNPALLLSHLGAATLLRTFGKTETWQGGDGGSLLLFAQKVVFEGEIRVGNGGRGFGSSSGGRGGNLAILTDFFQKTTTSADFFAGNGGDGGSEAGLGCGKGGDGGDAFLSCSEGANGANNAGSGNVTGGDGGTGGAGIPFANNALSDGCNGGYGGSGTSTNGNGTGGKGGNGGTGGSASPGLLGGPGGSGNNGGNGNGGNGGIGTGGKGGDGGNGGAESYSGGTAGAGGNGTGGDGTDGGNGIGGDGGKGGLGGNALMNGAFSGNGGQGGQGGSGYGGHSIGNVGNGGDGIGGNGGDGGNGGSGGAFPTYGGNGWLAGHGVGGNGLIGGNGFGGNSGNGGLSGGAADPANYGGCTSPGGNGTGGNSNNPCTFSETGGIGTGGFCGTSTHVSPLGCWPGTPPCQGQSTNGQNNGGCNGPSVSNITPTTATISWANCCATNFELRHRQVGTNTWTSTITSAQSQTLTNLTPGTDYEFQIQGFYAGTWTGFGPSVHFTTSSDADGDGYATAQGDCDDNNPATFPGAAEICDGLDNDCDGLADEAPNRWQNTIGGSGNEFFSLTKPTGDGGYIVGGTSNSNISGDKTEDSRGAGDYWVLKLDAAGDIVWQKTFGGSAAETLSDLSQTADGGYILAGHSASPTSGEKTEDNVSGRDFWILKLDAMGNIEWQNTIGGSGDEGTPKISQTADNGYILAGTSNSNTSGDKTEDGLGADDIWAIRLDASGNILWQNTIGGSLAEVVRSVEQTPDGSYVIGSQSDSNISGDKTENSNGLKDYWLVKLDASGDIAWQNTIGGSSDDYLEPVGLAADGGYILCGWSFSGISGDKTEANQGGWDFWVVKTDAVGNIVWENTIGGSGSDFANSIQQTAGGGYVVVGYSDSGISGDKTEAGLGSGDNWLLELDASGNIVSQKTFGGTGYDSPSSVCTTADIGYVVGGISNSNTSGDKTENGQGGLDFWIVKFAPDVVDNTPPTITCPANTTVAADASCAGTVGSHSAASTSDNCGTSNVTQSPSPSTPLNGHNDSETVTLTADDTHGNIASCSFTVTLKDVTMPDITCPASVTVCTSPAINQYIGTGALQPTVTDNCSTLANVSYQFTGATMGAGAGTATGKAFNLNATTIRYTVTDAGGSSSCSLLLTVRKSPLPYWQPPTPNPPVPVGAMNLKPYIKDYRSAAKTYKIYLGAPSGTPVCTMTAVNGVVSAGQNCWVTHSTPGLYQYYAVAINDYATGLDCEFVSGAFPVTVVGPGQTGEGDITLGSKDVGHTAPVLFPNPTDGLLNVLFEGGEQDGLCMMFYDTNGRLVMKSDGTRSAPASNAAAAVQQFDLSQLSGGVYLFRLVVGGQQYTGRVVKID